MKLRCVKKDKRWTYGPMRIYTHTVANQGLKYFVGIQIGRTIEDIECPTISYNTLEEAKNRAAGWMIDIRQALENIEKWEEFE